MARQPGVAGAATRARVAARTELFTESVIREMTRLIHLHHGDRGVNLAQGFPDFPAPAAVKDAARAAIDADLNQYAVTWGTQPLRDAIAAKTQRFGGPAIDPDREVCVTCGATEAMAATMLALVDPGDEVIVFSPYYENYWPDAVLAGATPRFVLLRAPDWSIDLDALAATFNARTRAIVINTPNNPTGKVFSRAELTAIAGLCQRWDAVAITDEIYEHLVYAGEHVRMDTLPGMRQRTITINGLSKTYSVTGWRIGYITAPPDLMGAIRKVHDFLTVGAPAPLQAAGVAALTLPDDYYHALREGYRERRDLMLEIARDAGFAPIVPDGAYYVMADIRGLTDEDDVTFAGRLVRDIGLAVVPGSSFYRDPDQGRSIVRFCFAKRRETLERAGDLLRGLSRSTGRQ